MRKKILFIVMALTCISVSPSYTNTCAKPDAAFMKTAVGQDQAESSCEVKAAARAANKARHGLEVFPLELISIQL